MSAATEAAHGEEEHIHLPEPNIWPFILAIFGLPLLPVGAIMLAYPTIETVTGDVLQLQPFGFPTLIVGTVITLISAFGWAGSVIKEKPTMDMMWAQSCLSSAWILFIVSEAAIFFSLFWYYGLKYYDAIGNTSWPPKGTPHIHLVIPAVGTIILFTSSLTCELAHKALLARQRVWSKNWIFLTLALGVAFLGLQGYEWGYLANGYDFHIDSGIIGTLFYLITGFHGIHVVTGLLLLALAYSRLEFGDMDNKRHFSLNAASWYWHFVDVIWVFVFLGFYVTLQ